MEYILCKKLRLGIKKVSSKKHDFHYSCILKYPNMRSKMRSLEATAVVDGHSRYSPVHDVHPLIVIKHGYG